MSNLWDLGHIQPRSEVVLEGDDAEANRPAFCLRDDLEDELEVLDGRGDARGVLQRAHGAFVSDLEVQRVVDFLKKQGSPDYDKSILDAPAASSGTAPASLAPGSTP